MLNLGLMTHPLNWITLAVWIVIVAFIIHIFDPQLCGCYEQKDNNS